MQNTNMLRSFIAVLFLMLVSQFMIVDASATPAIFGQAAGAGISLTAACQTCHTGASGSESKGNLKTGYQAAYNADKTNLTALKIKINGCPTGQVPNTTGTACVAPPPAPCLAPKKLINGVCTLPPPPAPAPCLAPKQVINGVCTLPPPPPPAPCLAPKQVINGVCTLPPPPPPAPCLAPKKVINGVCTTPSPMTCLDGVDGDEEDSKLKTSTPGKKVAVHAGQTLRLGVVAYGDDRNITIGGNLPMGASFENTYNGDLRLQQGVMVWTAPNDAAGKTLKVKFCAKAHGGGKPDSHSGSRKVFVKVLPKLTSVMNPDPAVAANVISSAVYNVVLQRLEVSGQVSWSSTSTIAERESAIMEPVKLSDAYDDIALGTVKVELDGKWSVSIQLPGTSMPHIIDATFQDRVGTQLVKKLRRDKLKD